MEMLGGWVGGCTARKVVLQLNCSAAFKSEMFDVVVTRHACKLGGSQGGRLPWPAKSASTGAAGPVLHV